MGMQFLSSSVISNTTGAKEFMAGTPLTSLQSLIASGSPESIARINSIIFLGMDKLGFSSTPFISATLGQVGMAATDKMAEMFVRNLETSTQMIDGVQYKYPVYGYRKEGTYLTVDAGSAGTKLGMAGSVFKITVKDKMLTKNGAFAIDARMLIVQDEPTIVGGAYCYTVKIQGAVGTDYILADRLTAGTFISTVAMSLNSTSHSVGTFGSTFNFAEATNQIGVFRKSYNINGLDKDKYLGLTIKLDNGQIVKTVIDWETAVFTMKFWKELEAWLFLSRYNRNSNGIVTDVDVNSGIPAPAPAGILEQIEAGGVYSGTPFSKRMIRDSIMDSFNFNYANFGKPKAREVWCITGSVGASKWTDEFSKDNEFLLSLQSGESVNFANGYAEIGTYVVNYRLLDGTVVRLLVSDMFDKGTYADSKPLGVDGKPITSSEMIFMDMTKYDGVQNLQYVTNKDTSFLMGQETGMTAAHANATMPRAGSTVSPFNSGAKPVSTGTANSTVHFLATAGIHLQMPKGAFIVRP